MQMKLNELIKHASAAYPDEMIAEYWDFDNERPRENPDAGDTLALFIANELADTYDSELPGAEQLEAAIRALERAAEEIRGVSEALVQVG